MSSDVPDDEIRIGTPEREHAIALLNEAFAAGYLAPDEFEQRSGQVYTARTRGELRATLRALPSADRLFPDTPSAPGSAAPAVGAPLTFRADWKTVRRQGVWEVPSHLSASVEWGTLILDFSRARLLGPAVELDLQGSVGRVKLRLGPDHVLNDERLSLRGWSSVKDKAGLPRRPGGPAVVLTGHLSGMSSVVVRRSG